MQFGKTYTREFFKDNRLIVFEKLTRACFFPNYTRNHTITYTGTYINKAFAVINQKGTFAPLVPPAKGQEGQFRRPCLMHTLKTKCTHTKLLAFDTFLSWQTNLIFMSIVLPVK